MVRRGEALGEKWYAIFMVDCVEKKDFGISPFSLISLTIRHLRCSKKAFAFQNVLLINLSNNVRAMLETPRST